MFSLFTSPSKRLVLTKIGFYMFKELKILKLGIINCMLAIHLILIVLNILMKKNEELTLNQSCVKDFIVLD